MKHTSGPLQPVDRQNWCILTVNIGRYDAVHPVPVDASAADWVYVTDDLATAHMADAGGWRVVVLEPSGQTNFLRSRYPKARPDHFTDRPRSLYVDARYIVETEAVVDHLSEFVDREAWIALFAHDDRNNIFDEAAECERLGVGGPEVAAQMSHYRSLGVGRDAGLWCGGVLVRRHCEAQRRFGDAWLRELGRWPTRDQLSLPVVLSSCGEVPVEIVGSVYAWPGLSMTPHRVQRRRRWSNRAISAVRRWSAPPWSAADRP